MTYALIEKEAPKYRQQSDLSRKTSQSQAISTPEEKKWSALLIETSTTAPEPYLCIKIETASRNQDKAGLLFGFQEDKILHASFLKHSAYQGFQFPPCMEPDVSTDFLISIIDATIAREIEKLRAAIKAEQLLHEASLIEGEESDIDILRKIIYSTEMAFAKSRFEFVDEVLRQFDPTKFPVVIGIGILRTTFRARIHLKEWDYCLENVSRHIFSKRKDGQKLLRGLFPAHGRITYIKEQALL